MALSAFGFVLVSYRSDTSVADDVLLFSDRLRVRRFMGLMGEKEWAWEELVQVRVETWKRGRNERAKFRFVFSTGRPVIAIRLRRASPETVMNDIPMLRDFCAIHPSVASPMRYPKGGQRFQWG
jgi:hypothetical protein